MDIVERLRAHVIAYEITGRKAAAECEDIRDAIAEIESLRKQWAEMACRILTQAQQTNAMVRDANDRIDTINRERRT